MFVHPLGFDPHLPFSTIWLNVFTSQATALIDSCLRKFPTHNVSGLTVSRSYSRHKVRICNDQHRLGARCFERHCQKLQCTL